MGIRPVLEPKELRSDTNRIGTPTTAYYYYYYYYYCYYSPSSRITWLHVYFLTVSWAMTLHINGNSDHISRSNNNKNYYYYNYYHY